GTRRRAVEVASGQTGLVVPPPLEKEVERRDEARERLLRNRAQPLLVAARRGDVEAALHRLDDQPFGRGDGGRLEEGRRLDEVVGELGTQKEAQGQARGLQLPPGLPPRPPRP